MNFFKIAAMIALLPLVSACEKVEDEQRSRSIGQVFADFEEERLTAERRNEIRRLLDASSLNNIEGFEFSQFCKLLGFSMTFSFESFGRGDLRSNYPDSRLINSRALMASFILFEEFKTDPDSKWDDEEGQWMTSNDQNNVKVQIALWGAEGAEAYLSQNEDLSPSAKDAYHKCHAVFAQDIPE